VCWGKKDLEDILDLYNFDTMNILLNIPDEVVGKYQHQAEQDKRSRKNLMEKVLIDYFENAKVQVQDLNKPTNSIQPFQQPQTNYFVNTAASVPKPRKTPEQWISEKRELADAEAYQIWFKELEADPWLSSKQKSIIKQA
jgi:hypothetical protein